MTVRQAVNEITRMYVGLAHLTEVMDEREIDVYLRSIYTCHDDAKDKEFELELSWICAESKYKHQFVPHEIKQEAERLAKVNDCI